MCTIILSENVKSCYQSIFNKIGSKRQMLKIEVPSDICELFIPICKIESLKLNYKEIHEGQKV